MTIGTVVSRLRNTIREYHPDSRVTARHLWNIAYTASLELLEREKKTLTNLDIFTTVSLDSEEVNAYMDTCVPLECLTCRYKLPKGYTEGKNGLRYRYISTADKSSNFHLVTPQAFQSRIGIKGNNNKYAYLDNGYLYTSECYPCIEVSIATENGITADGCSVLDQESPIPDRLLNRVFSLSLNELFNMVRIPIPHIDNKNTGA